MRALRKILVLVVVLCALAAPGVARAAGPMFVGAVENAPLQTNLVAAKAKVDLAQLAGFDALRIVVFWGPGRASEVPEWDLAVLKNAATAAQLDGIRLIVSVSNYDSRTTPRTARDRQQFAIYCATLARALPSVTDFIIGNEPNLNLFWLPQFTQPKYKTVTKKVRVKGKVVKKKVKVLTKPAQDAAAIGYEALLAQTYDTLKSINPLINVIGVALSPRGGDNPNGKRKTHSPTTFLLDLGKAYRATHRTKPLMDAFAMHPYLEKSSLPPSFAHPKSTSIGLADYNKLVALLTKAFKGTPQPGSTLPIVYDEFGVQSRIPSAKTSQYFNLRTLPAQDAVSETTQTVYYRQALQMAYCQPNVMGMLLFHVSDERNGKAWQSGLYYADDTPKSSRDPVRDAIASVHDGTFSSCAGAGGATALQSVTFPKPTTSTYTTNDVDWTAAITCVNRCTYYAKIEEFPGGKPVFEVLADLDPGVPGTINFPRAPLPPGQYRMVVRVWKYGKLGTAVVRFGTPFTVALPPAPPLPPAPGPPTPGPSLPPPPPPTPAPPAGG
jgi:hypothetical protein